MKLIINADDFGVNSIVTEQIIVLIEKSVISSTTIMANGRCFDECVEYAIKHPEISYGIHLCLSEFESLTKSPVLYKYGLIDSSGCFIRLAIFKKFFIPRELKDALKNELRAQIEKVTNAGLCISHADSHQHVHLHVRFAGIFDSVLKEYKITKVRRSKPYEKKCTIRNMVGNLRKLLVNKVYSKYITTEYFNNCDVFLKNQFTEIGVAELMCHPGHPSSRYQKEIELLLQKISTIRNSDIINYCTLK